MLRLEGVCLDEGPWKEVYRGHECHTCIIHQSLIELKKDGEKRLLLCKDNDCQHTGIRDGKEATQGRQSFTSR
jgi:hypothetical protein